MVSAGLPQHLGSLKSQDFYRKPELSGKTLLQILDSQEKDSIFVLAL